MSTVNSRVYGTAIAAAIVLLVGCLLATGEAYADFQAASSTPQKLSVTVEKNSTAYVTFKTDSFNSISLESDSVKDSYGYDACYIDRSKTDGTTGTVGLALYAAGEHHISLVAYRDTYYEEDDEYYEDEDYIDVIVTVSYASISKTYVMLYPGKTQKVTAKGASGVTWSSSNPEVATVSKSGKIKGKELGICTITATKGDMALSCRVEVTTKKAFKAVQNAYKDMKTKITYSQPKRMQKKYRDCSSFTSRCYWDSSLNRKVFAIGGATGKTWALTAAGQAKWLKTNGKCVGMKDVGVSNMLPGDTIHYVTGYAGKNKEYRSIDHEALYVGNGLIMDTHGYGGKGCIGTRYYAWPGKISFVGRPTAQFMLNNSLVTLNAGKTKQLKGKFASGTISWKSSNSSIAKVSKKGVITAKKAGVATITAKSGGKSYKCRVVVK